MADPTSRNSLRKLAEKIRQLIGFQSKTYFPVLPFIENIMYDIPEFKLNLEVVNDSKLPGREAETRPHENKIVVRESVYNDAVNGLGRARFTLMHELAHLILIDDKTVRLCRMDSSIPAYLDPEWQANTLASELLIPPNLSAGMSIDEISENFGVSKSAAKVHIKMKNTQGLN